MQTTPLSPEDPTELGGFELLGRIGHGGMGQVFLGESQGGEPAAVKVIKPTVVDSESRSSPPPVPVTAWTSSGTGRRARSWHRWSPQSPDELRGGGRTS
ncbi:hypothetical protein OG936_30930 [Streptomyces sp. NBC_00846]|uniref:hypothetical protein n=1 Tax=Streptomyces sp. NBC_00846 TaxID=2975849 RepID=UPI0038668FF1|nr:hypothetical protein OG936_30930 [Streptomyces sp. NBC_00846]